MIGIKINGSFLDLDPDTTIPYDINSDILNFEEVEGIVSFPFYFSNTPVNEQTFQHARVIAVKNNKRYYDAEIFFKGHKIYDAEFELESAGSQKYEGKFLVDAAVHHRDKDKLIGDIITKEITLPGKDASDLDGYRDEENDMVFPMFHFQDYFAGNNHAYKQVMNWHSALGYESTISRVNSGKFVYWASGFLPCFKLLYVLKMLLAEWGYALIDHASKSAEDLRKVILFNNVQIDERNKYYVDLGGGTFGIGTGLPEKVKVASHLPKMTVQKFLQMIRSFGISINFDSNKKTCKILLIKDVITDIRYEDWSNKALPGTHITYPIYKGIEFSFADSKDKRQSDDKEKSITDNIEDPVDELSDLPTADKSIINQVRLVREYNSYFICDENDNAPSAGPYYVWNHHKDANEEIQIGEPDEKISVPWAPVHEEKAFYYKEVGSKLENNGSAKLKITVQDGLMDAFLSSFDKVAVEKPTHAEGGFVSITSIPDGTTFEADATYAADADSVDFTIERKLFGRIPDVDIEGNYQKRFSGVIADTYRSRSQLTIAINNIEFVPRLLFYHGLVEDTTAVDYPMATASGFDNAGNRLTAFALRWTGDDGLYKYFWEDVINFKKNLKEVEQPVVLELQDLISFDRFRKVMIDNNKFLVKRIKAELTMKGISVSQVEMYNVV